MVGVTSIEVKESLDDLVKRLRQAETAKAIISLASTVLAQTGECTDDQCDRQSHRETSQHSASLVMEIPSWWTG